MTDCIKNGEVVNQVWAEQKAGSVHLGSWRSLEEGWRADCYSVRGLETLWPQAPGLRDLHSHGAPQKPEAAENTARPCQPVTHT